MPVTAGGFGRVRLAVEVLGVYVRVRWLVLRRGAVPAVSFSGAGCASMSTLSPTASEFCAGCDSVAPW